MDPRQCFRGSRRASLAPRVGAKRSPTPRRSLHSLSARFPIDQIAKMSTNCAMSRFAPARRHAAFARVRRDAKGARFARRGQALNGRKGPIRGPGGRNARRVGRPRAPTRLEDLAQLPERGLSRHQSDWHRHVACCPQAHET